MGVLKVQYKYTMIRDPSQVVDNLFIGLQSFNAVISEGQTAERHAPNLCVALLDHEVLKGMK